MNDLLRLGVLANAMSGGGNRDNLFPQDDVADLASGATHIPGQVTLARRRDERVVYNHDNTWTMPDGQTVD